MALACRRYCALFTVWHWHAEDIVHCSLYGTGMQKIVCIVSLYGTGMQKILCIVHCMALACRRYCALFTVWHWHAEDSVHCVIVWHWHAEDIVHCSLYGTGMQKIVCIVHCMALACRR